MSDHIESKKRVADLSKPVNATPKELHRFFSKVDKSSSPNGCWLWTACTDENGYGKFTFRRRVVKASRLAWSIQIGPIPEGLHLLHNCPGGDNPACINPAHLRIGTAADNSADAVAKGQTPAGERHKSKTHPETVLRGVDHPLAKLDESMVREIRNRIALGEVQTSIAAAYGISRTAVSAIATRRTWPQVQ